MGKTVIVEGHLQERIGEFKKQNDFTIGLILGQHTEQKDYVVWLAKSLLQEEGTADENEDGEKNLKIQIPHSLNDVDENSVVAHAIHVERMLPGGMDVLGLFVIGDKQILDDPLNQSKLKSLIQLIARSIGEFREPFDHILLTICEKSLHHTCRSVNIEDINSSLKPADWKYSSTPTMWQEIVSSLSLNSTIPVTKTKITKPLRVQIKFGLSSLLGSIEEAIMLVDDELKVGNSLLNDNTEDVKTKKRKSKSTETSYKSHNIELLLQSPKQREPIIHYDCAAVMNLQGKIAARAYVHPKATVSDAENAIKSDIYRSIKARVEIHCDAILNEEQQTDTMILHETPRRVCAILPHSNIFLSDYLFPGEDIGDSVEPFDELLGISVSKSDINDTIETVLHSESEEHLPTPEELFSSDGRIAEKQVDKLISSSVPTVLLGITVLLGLVAIYIAYIQS